MGRKLGSGGGFPPPPSTPLSCAHVFCDLPRVPPIMARLSGPPSPVHCVLFPLSASPCLSGPSPFLPSLLISILNLSPTLLLLHLPPSSDGKAQMQCRRPRFNSWVRKIPWRRKWKLTPAVLPGESHGQRSLVGYSPRGHNELDTTEQLTHINTHTPLSLPFSLVPLFCVNQLLVG